MIRQETISTFSSANALYSGFAAFVPYSYISGPTSVAPPTGGGGGQNAFVGQIQGALGGGIESGMQQPWLLLDTSTGGF